MTTPEIQYCTTSDGVSIAYTDSGEGPPLVITSAVLWSHIGYTSAITEVFAAGGSIAAHHRVVRYDARGTGMSDRRTMDFSLETRVADLECVVDHLGLERFALYAFTHGAPTAVSCASRHPRRLTHLILFNPIAHGADWRHRVRRHDSARELAEEEWEEFTLMIANANFGYRDSEKALALAERLRVSMTPKALRAFYASVGDIDIGDILALVSVPTLVISNDAMRMPVEWHHEVAAKIPGAKLVRTSAQPDEWWGEQETRALAEFLGDALPAASRAGIPSTFRTVLFTDLVGHTEMMSRLGDDRGRVVLREHERITREVLKAHGGTEVKTMGDGFMASFGSVTRAVECAVALQKAIDERNRGAGAQHPALSAEGEWSQEGTVFTGDASSHGAAPLRASVEPVSVRIGLNAGEPIEEEGDLFGATVILASRIAGRAEGGEILVADTVRGLCSGKGFLFADRGEFVAKGFEEPVRVYEVRWRDG
jgi:class 3 adenylate cyclase